MAARKRKTVRIFPKPKGVRGKAIFHLSRAMKRRDRKASQLDKRAAEAAEDERQHSAMGRLSSARVSREETAALKARSEKLRRSRNRFKKARDWLRKN